MTWYSRDPRLIHMKEFVVKTPQQAHLCTYDGCDISNEKGSPLTSNEDWPDNWVWCELPSIEEPVLSVEDRYEIFDLDDKCMIDLQTVEYRLAHETDEKKRVALLLQLVRETHDAWQGIKDEGIL